MKRFTAVIVIAALFTGLCACRGNSDIKNLPDAETVADALNAGLVFGEELEKSSPEVAVSYYGLDPSLCNKIAFYAGSGATADEIAVFDCADAGAVEKVKKAVEARRKYLRDGYADYGPAEVPKIDAAVFAVRGKLAVFCVCENPERVNDVLKLMSFK